MTMTKDWLKVGVLFGVSVVFVMLCFRTPLLLAVVPVPSHLPPVLSLLYAIWLYVVLIGLPVTVPAMVTFSWLRGRPVFVRAAVSVASMLAMVVVIDFAG